MNYNTNISCDVCLDLFPLVKDGVASEDSIAIVNEHIDCCKGCKDIFNRENINKDIQINDKKVIGSIKKKLYLTGILLILIGGLFGIGLSNSMGMFYNFTIMPIIGVCSYFLLKNKWFYAPTGVFVLAYFWLLIVYFIEGILEHSTIIQFFTAPLVLSSIYTILTIVGVIIGGLLKFAFKKEKRDIDD